MCFFPFYLFVNNRNIGSKSLRILETHKWIDRGAYTIRSKAKDVYNVESDWATLEVSMPKNKFLLIDSLLEGFPLLKHMLLFYHQHNI